jgi:hypothetical protein
MSYGTHLLLRPSQTNIYQNVIIEILTGLVPRLIQKQLKQLERRYWERRNRDAISETICEEWDMNIQGV